MIEEPIKFCNNARDVPDNELKKKKKKNLIQGLIKVLFAR